MSRFGSVAFLLLFACSACGGVQHKRTTPKGIRYGMDVAAIQDYPPRPEFPWPVGVPDTDPDDE